jgi:flagellar motor switch protein FliN/FliY
MSEQNEPRKWLIAEWARRFEQAFEAMTGEKLALSRTDEQPTMGDDALGWEQPLDADANCTFWVGASEAAWQEVGAVALRAAGIDEPEPADVKSTWLELVGQANSITAQNLGARLGREVNAGAGHESTNSQSGSQVASFAVQLADKTGFFIQFGLSPALEALLDVGKSAVEVGETNESAKPLSGGPKTLDLLLEVELPVAVSFGRTELLLKDVLKLTTGSIVELNRSIIEPVEIIVNNCVIARGEVVVVEGNYGVRITEVISRQERLRTLH